MRWTAMTALASSIAWTLFSWNTTARACTLYAAAGDEWVEGGGTLLVKNRDWQPNQQHELRLINPTSGHPYVGLFATGGESSGLKAGINEQGLVVVTATAGAIPEKERSAMKGAKGVTTRLLSGCDSVEAALKKTDLFLGPQYIMMADRKQVAYVEIGPEGKFAVNSTNKGFLRHTNHYLEEGMLPFNKTIGESSRTRGNRIAQLLSETPHPFNLKQCIAFSHDQTAGPDNSILRTGSKPTVSRTVAIWIVALPPTGSPRLYLKIMDPGQPERVIEADLDDVFAGRNKAILDNPKPAKEAK